MDFQDGQPVLGGFLSEAMTEQSPRIRSSFNECVILATICGRSLFHGQQYHVLRVYEDVSPDWADQHRWLDTILTSRLNILSKYYPLPTETCDPMLLFANIMGQATIIYLCKGMESVLWTIDDGKALAVEYQQRALAAAEQIISLAKVLMGFHLFKVSLHLVLLVPLVSRHLLTHFQVHPLMPIPLLLCAEFLYSNRSSHESFNLRLQELLDIFRQLKNVNNANQSYMQLLEISSTSSPLDLTNETSIT